MSLGACVVSIPINTTYNVFSIRILYGVLHVWLKVEEEGDKSEILEIRVLSFGSMVAILAHRNLQM